MKKGLKLFSVFLAMVMSVCLCMGGLSVETLSASDGDYDYSSEPNDSWYYYEIEVLKEVEILSDGLTEHGGRSIYFNAYGYSADHGGNLFPINDSNIMELGSGELQKEQTMLFAVPVPLQQLEFFEDDYAPGYWIDSCAVYVSLFDTLEQKPGKSNAVKLSKMYQVVTDDDELVLEPGDLEGLKTLEQQPVKFVNQYTATPEDMIKYELDAVIEVEQAGNVAPGEKTFTFEILYSDLRPAALSARSIENLLYFDMSMKAKPVTVSGAGVHNVTLEFYSPVWLDMLGVRLVDDGSANWEYDPTEYALRYSNYNAIEVDEFEIGVYDPEQEDIMMADELYFHNVYNKNSAPAPIVEEDTYTITAKARNHGEISPEGDVTVKEGRDKTFEITPDKGYEISRVVIDGEDLSKKKLAVVKLDGEYTFYDVDEDHTIKVYFSKIEEEVPAKDEIEEVNPNTGAI